MRANGSPPGHPDDLLHAPAVDLARRIRARELSPVDVVRTHVARIRRVDPTLNAMVATRFDEALDEARAAERRVARTRRAARDRLPPLLGVPCTIKAAFGMAGMPWHSGLVARADIVADRDAPAVARLRAAGAIPLGLTNVPEGLMWFETYNRLHGRTRNPYDPARTAGGSSGGEGAIVGAGGAPFGLGSDVAGSVRLPAFFNGVFAHKNSGGRVACAGQFPPTWGPRARLLCTGPLTRRADDLLPLTRLIADPDWRDSAGRRHGWDVPPALDDGDLSGLRVFVNDAVGPIAVHADVSAAVDRAADALARRGAAVERWHHPRFDRALEIWTAVMDAAPGWSFAEILGDGAPIRLGRELLRAAVGRSPHIAPSLALCVFERVAPRFSGGWLPTFAAWGRELKADLDERLGDDGVLLMPPFPRVAMRHRAPLLRPLDFIYSAIVNAMLLPATEVPLGLDGRGLPLGTQVIGAEGRDALTIAVARALEAELGGWIPPARWRCGEEGS